VYLSIGVITVAVSLIAMLLVARLVAVSDDPLLARQIGWNLLAIAVSAGALSAVLACSGSTPSCRTWSRSCRSKPPSRISR